MTEESVLQRYAKGADVREESLCCPVTYDVKYLKALPQEILDRDYGCGDPSAFVHSGETVLDLGSGGGKICYIASQIVGAKGKVIGVDFNPPMLALARKYQKEMAQKIGWSNVRFLRARIQDLRTDLEWLDRQIAESGVKNLADYDALQEKIRQKNLEAPMIAEASIDVVISNCVLNLVRKEDRRQLFAEMYRVLRPGGRIAISDIVSDEPVPDELQHNPHLWSGCLSGAFQEKDFLNAFEHAGFRGVAFAKWDEKPWQTVRGIEFRSVTVTATKGDDGRPLERNQAVVYRGPWSEVRDGKRVFQKGMRTAVSDKEFQLYAQEAFCDEMILLPPRIEIPMDQAGAYACCRATLRDPRESKGQGYDDTGVSSSGCC